MPRLSLLLAFGMFPLAGCSESSPRYAASYKVAAERAEAPAAMPAEPAFANLTPPETPGPAGGEGAPTSPPPGAAGISRKVIYDATLDLTVQSVEEAGARVGALVEQSGGYIAEETVTGSPGSKRARYWKIRVPIERFESFVGSVTALGELERFDRKSKDVTAEYYDVDAQIKNKKIEEQTLQKLLEERSGELVDVLKVGTELSRVRGEIERLQGQLRVLENLSSLATLTLNIRERESFEPPAPVVADFPTQIGRVWTGSVQSLVDLGKSWTLFLVGQIVWLPFWIVGLLVAWLVARRLPAAARWLYAASQKPIHLPLGNPPSAPGAGEERPNP